MRYIRSYLLIIPGLLVCLNVNAQLDHNISLASYIKDIESKYEVIFSYANNRVNNLSLPKPENLKDLNEHIKHLRDHTPFKITKKEKKRILLIPKFNGENICISLHDHKTKKRVDHSYIQYNDHIYTTDHEGKFYLLTDKDKITVSVFIENLNHQTFTIDTDTNVDCVELPIHTEVEMLDEVILTDYLTQGIEKITSGGIKINYKDFGLLPGLIEPDVLQTIQALPGIISRKESVSYLNVRGGTHDQNLFLWDGIKMYNTSHFFGMISVFNPQITESVSLIKNGTSPKYGSGVSSLINMTSSDEIAKNLKAEAGLNLTNIDAKIELPVSKNASIEFSSRQSINALWESYTYDRYFDKVFQNTQVTDFEEPELDQDNDFNYYDGTLNYKHQLTKDDFLKLSLFFADDSFSLNRFNESNSKTRKSQLEQTNFAAGANYEKKWSETVSSQIQLYSSNYNQNAVNRDLINEQKLEQINEVREIALRLNVQNQLNSNFTLENGYQFKETGILNSQEINDPELFRQTQNAVITNSLYSQLNYRSDNERIFLNIGARLNYISKFDKLLVEPRFNLSYQFIDNLFLEVLAEQKSQVTSQIINSQTDFLGVENRRWVLSLPDTRPVIQSDQISAGLNFVKKDWLINTDVYYKQVNGITTRGQDFQNQFELSAAHGSYTIKGIDFQINKNFNPISGWISYSLSENQYNFESLAPSIFPNNLDIRHVVSTGLNYEKNGFKISTGLNWHSGVTTTDIKEQQTALPQEIQFESPNATRLKDYLRLDVSSTYEFSLSDNSKARVGFSIWNLLGNDNVYNQIYRIGNNEDIHRFHQTGLAFTPNFVFRLYFD